MKLSIIIVNYNTVKLLESCLQSVLKALLFAKLDKSSEIIVVDNASADDSVVTVKSHFPYIKLICNNKNLGYAKANNQGIRKSKGKYILLLNSDTRVTQEVFQPIIKLMENNKNIGVVGCKLLNSDGSIQTSAGFFPTLPKVFFWMTFWDDVPILRTLIKPYHVDYRKFYNKTREVDWVTGAFMLVRREIIKICGYLDGAIFMYGEEVEWCFRIKKAGFKIYFLPSVSVFHYKGGSGVGIEAGIVEEFGSLMYFYNKHMRNWQIFSLRFILRFGAWLRFLLFGIIMGDLKKKNLYAKALKVVG